jgi:hypothetical protein
MPLLTELDGIAVGDVAISMPLLAELENPRRLVPSSARSAMFIANVCHIRSKLR